MPVAPLRLSMSLAIAAACLQAQQWQPASVPHHHQSVTVDVVRGRSLILAGGSSASLTATPDQLWSFDGQQLSLQVPIGATAPPPFGSMAHDPLRDRAVCVASASGAAPQTWEFDGATWQQLALAFTPNADNPLVFDPLNGAVLLLDSTSTAWHFDGVAWNASPTISPVPGRYQAGIAFDPARQVLVLHGGVTATGSFDDTWEFDGQTWTRRITAHAPPPGGMTIAYDVVRGAMIARFSSLSLQGTWSYDGIDWTTLPMVTEPTPNQTQRLATSMTTGRCLLFGRGGPHELVGNAWIPSPTAATPPPRYGGALATDLRRDVLLLHGGRQSTTGATTPTDLGDLWLLFGDQWIEQHASPAPLARAFHGFVRDEANDRAVLFGGLHTNYFGDTWSYAAGQWTMHLGAGPTARARFSMVYDPRRRHIVLFGGEGAGGRRDDTWTFDATGWHAWVTGPGPAARAGLAMAYDAAGDRCVVFGGETALGTNDETWTLDDAGWHQLAPVASPAPRHSAACAYDPFTGSVTLDGGRNGNVVLGDFWQLRGDVWQQSATVASPLAGASMAPRPTRLRVDRVGGYYTLQIFTTFELPVDEHWLLLPDAQASAAVHGTGCPGSNGTPSLHPLGSSTPTLGGNFVLQLEHAPPNPGFAAIVFGTGLATFAGEPLPLDLQALGMPGCALWIAADVLVPVAVTGGTATLTVPMPALPALSGAPLVAQAYVPDPSAPGQATVSNAIAAVLR